MKKYNRLFISTFVFFIVITGIRILWILQFSPMMNADVAINGQLNITELSDKSDLYPLAGEWTYYPEKLITNEQLQKNQFKDIAETKKFPDDWFKIASSPDYRYGTFHMQLTIDGELLDESLSFHVPDTKLSSRLFVQGKEKIGRASCRERG